MNNIDGMLFLQAGVGCVIAVISMMIMFGLVKIAANMVIALIGIILIGANVFGVIHGDVTGWVEVVAFAFISGGAAALLCLPVLPFSSFYKRK